MRCDERRFVDPRNSESRFINLEDPISQDSESTLDFHSQVQCSGMNGEHNGIPATRCHMWKPLTVPKDAVWYCHRHQYQDECPEKEGHD